MTHKNDAFEAIDVLDSPTDDERNEFDDYEINGSVDEIVDSIELLIADYLDDALSPEDKSSFESLVEKDESLRKRVEEERNAWNALDLLDVDPNASDLVETTVERLNAETQAELTQITETQRRARRRLLIVQIAASVVLLLSGYFAFASVLPNAEARRERDAKVVERLAQLEAVGDYDFLVALDGANLFDEWRAKVRDNQLATDGKSDLPQDARPAEVVVERPYSELAQDRVFYRLERRFEAMSSDEQENWRKLRQQIDDSPNAAKLLRTLDDYNYWLATSTSPSDRERLDAMSTYERIAEIQRKIEESNRALDFFRKMRERPGAQGFPPTAPGAPDSPDAPNDDSDKDDKQPEPPKSNPALSALRASLPDEVKNENLASVYCQYAQFLQRKGGDAQPKNQCEGVVSFLKETDANCLVDGFSDCGKNYVNGLDESTKSTILGLLVSISFLEETERNRAPETRPFQNRPNREKPQNRNQFGPRGGGPDFRMKGESVEDLARTLRDAHGGARDYITSCPAQEARGLLLGLHWGNWFGGRFAPVGMPTAPPNPMNDGRPPRQPDEPPQS